MKAKVVAKISNKDWDEYYGNKDNWERDYFGSPINGLGFRNRSKHLIYGCVASGISSSMKGHHCGGIDQISYSLHDEIYKIDRYAIVPTLNSDDFEIVMLNKYGYKEIHHICENDLLKEYPKLLL